MNDDERIEQKSAELFGVFTELSAEQKKIAADLIRQAAFLAVTLENLAEDIKESGPVETYVNGQHQHGRKISSSAKLYSSLVSKYATIVSKLLGLIPKESRPEKEEPARYDPATDPARIAAQKKFDEQRAKEQAFCDALRAGKIQQSDYRAFMDGEIAV